MRLGRLEIHRKEQWDLGAPSVYPILAAHWRSPTSSRRVFCLWSRGIRIGRWSFQRAPTPSGGHAQ